MNTTRRSFLTAFAALVLAPLAVFRKEPDGLDTFLATVPVLIQGGLRPYILVTGPRKSGVTSLGREILRRRPNMLVTELPYTLGSERGRDQLRKTAGLYDVHLHVCPSWPTTPTSSRVVIPIANRFAKLGGVFPFPKC